MEDPATYAVWKASNMEYVRKEAIELDEREPDCEPDRVDRRKERLSRSPYPSFGLHTSAGVEKQSRLLPSSHAIVPRVLGKFIKPSVARRAAEDQANGIPSEIDFGDERNYLTVTFHDEATRLAGSDRAGVLPRPEDYRILNAVFEGMKELRRHSGRSSNARAILDSGIQTPFARATGLHSDTNTFTTQSRSLHDSHLIQGSSAARATSYGLDKVGVIARENMEEHLRYLPYQYMQCLGNGRQTADCDPAECLASPYSKAYLALFDSGVGTSLENRVGPCIGPPACWWKFAVIHPKVVDRTDQIYFRSAAHPNSADTLPGVSVAELLWRTARVQGAQNVVFPEAKRSITVQTRNIPAIRFRSHKISTNCNHGGLTRVGLAFHLAWLLSNGSRRGHDCFDLRVIRLVAIYSVRGTDEWYVVWACPMTSRDVRKYTAVMPTAYRGMASNQQ